MEEFKIDPWFPLDERLGTYINIASGEVAHKSDLEKHYAQNNSEQKEEGSR